MPQSVRHTYKPPKPPSSRPIGRPPSSLVTPVIGWAERRRYARFCSAPYVPVEPPPTPKPMRGTPATRARTPWLSQARIHHNADAPPVVTWGDIQLHRTREYGVAWQCSICTSWTRAPTSRLGYVGHCTLCRLTRPPRVVLLNSPDVSYIREHAALAHAAAARLRSERYAMLRYGPTVRFKRESVTPSEFFLNEAEHRDRLFAPLPVTDEQAAQERTVVQVWCHGERYVGLGGIGFTTGALPTAVVNVLAPRSTITQASRLPGSRYQEPSLTALASMAAQQEQPMPNLTPNPHRSTLNGALELLGLELANTLTATRICQVHATQARRRELRVTFTVDAPHLPAWHDVVARVLDALEGAGVDVAIAQVCLRHDGELLAPWQIRVTADDAERLQRDVMQVRKAFLRLVNPNVDRPVPRSFAWFHDACDRQDAENLAR